MSTPRTRYTPSGHEVRKTKPIPLRLAKKEREAIEDLALKSGESLNRVTRDLVLIGLATKNTPS